MSNFKKNNRGDTIIEVLLAMTILTLILFTAWGLVNRSTQASLAARQRIEMVNKLKEQAEILKAQFAKGELSNSDSLRGAVATSEVQYDQAFCSDTEAFTQAGSGGFHFIAEEGVLQLQPGAKTTNESQRVWVEYKSGNGFREFFIRGCWLTSGGSQKTDNSQIVLRLNT